MMMINSSPSPSSTGADSSKRLRLTIPRNSKTDHLTTSSSNTHSPHKFDEKTTPTAKKSIDCNNTMTTMKQQLSTSIDNENDTTLLTTTTTTTTVEVKVKTTKTSSSSSSRKRKLHLVDDTLTTTDDNLNKQEQEQDEEEEGEEKQQQTLSPPLPPPSLPAEQSVSKKKKKARATNNETISESESSSNDNQQAYPLKTVDQASVTDESSFGSCEPGTSVVLQGIVWNETDKGVLVVNITWRGKTYVGALLNTTEQNWAPPRYKSDTRPTKHNRHNHHHNSNRDYLLTATTSSPSAVQSQPSNSHSSHEPTERILRNGKRRGPCATVTPTATSKSNSFKIPEAPPSKADETLTTNDKLLDSGSGAPSSSSTSVNDEDETNSISEEKTLVRNGVDDETGDNCSSRSVSPTTSGGSTTSSSPPPSIQEKPDLPAMMNNHSVEPHLPPSIPMDLSNSRTAIKLEDNSSSYNSILQRPSPSKALTSPPSFLSSFTTKSSKSKSKDTHSTPPSLLSPHPFGNPILFASPNNPSGYFPVPPPGSFLHGSGNPFGLPSFHPQSSPLHNHHSKNKLSPTSSSAISPSSYLPIPPQLYFNPLTTPRFPSACSAASPSSFSKSSR